MALVALVSALLASGPLRDRDWGFHLATFERIVAERRLPVDDTFSYTAERPYEPVHVLFQLAAGGLSRALGDERGIGVLRLALAVAIGAALFGALRRRGLGGWSAAALTLVVQAGGAFRLVERPHLVTTLGLVLLLDALLAWRERALHRPLRLVPLLWVWANAHGPGVVFAVLTAWGFLALEALRGRPRLGGLLLCVVLGTLATLLNPLGPDLYAYLLRQDEVRDLAITELRPLWVMSSPLPVLGAGLFVLGAALVARRPRRVDPTLALAAAAFGGLALYISREVSLALVPLAFVVAPALRAARWSPRAGRAAFALALVPAALLVGREVRAGLALGRWPGGLDPACHPVSCADWILEHRPRGRLYNTNAVGSYLERRLVPARYRVYSDGRIPMFAQALRAESDFAALEARWAPDILVIDFTHGERYVPPCEQSPGFAGRYALVHVGGAAKLYLRRGGENDALIERFAYRHLRYLGRFWPGRALWDDRRGFVYPVPPPAHTAEFAAEVARARREDPWAARWLP